jgi:hypothetical protein
MVIAPASGPTVAATALARDESTGRFIATDGHGRSDAERRVIAARRAQVATLYPAKTPDEIGPELGWSPATIDKDVAWLVQQGVVPRQAMGPRRKYPPAERRPCKGCGDWFTPPSWAPSQRFHSIRCARSHQTTDRVRATARELKTQQRRRADGEIARLNAAGYLTSRQLAAERCVTESTVSQWISRGLLAARREIIEDEPHQLIRQEEFDRFNREEWPRILVRIGGWTKYPKNWGQLPRVRWPGRNNKVLAEAKGKKVGPKGLPLCASEKAEILERLQRAQTQEQIASEMGGGVTRWIVRRVEREAKQQV